MKVRVYYEDTDSNGIVYHTKYINFCERARSEIFFKNNLNPQMNGYYFVVKNIEANFMGNSKLGDILEVKTKVIKKAKVFLILNQSIYLKDSLIFDMNIKLASLKNGKITKMPKIFEDIISLIESNQK